MRADRQKRGNGMKRGRSLLLYLGLWLMIFSGAAFLFSRYFQRNMETGEMTADPSSAYKVIELFPGRPKFLVENSLEDGGRYCVDLSELAAGDGTYRTAYMEPDGRGRVWLHMEVWQKEALQIAQTAAANKIHLFFILHLLTSSPESYGKQNGMSGT